MPTVYTDALYDGKPVSFSEFAMNCARVSSHLAFMREDSKAPIPDHFDPPDKKLKDIEQFEKAIARVKKWSIARAEKEAQKKFDEDAKSFAEKMGKVRTGMRAYADMLSRVNLWKPPTKDHEWLKGFMIEQLADSLRWDCLFGYRLPKRWSGRQWKEYLIDSFRESIRKLKEEHQSELERARERTKWVRELRASL